jgi:ABC-type antimicrobial peptide transport system permease subunit
MDAGIYLGEQVQEYAAQFYMPERLYPGISSEVLLTAPIVMLIGTQIAAFLPALRIRRLKPVEALREE